MEAIFFIEQLFTIKVLFASCIAVSQLSMCSLDFEKYMNLWDLTQDRRLGNIVLKENFLATF